MDASVYKGLKSEMINNKKLQVEVYSWTGLRDSYASLGGSVSQIVPAVL